MRPRLSAYLAPLLAACAAGTANAPQSADPDDLLIVDCLLPSQIKNLGTRVTYATARRAVKTTAIDCRIRGGEYVAFDRASHSTALRVWLPMAEGGNAEAQNYVGEIYERGLGVAPDYAAAALWYRRAAAQDHAAALVNLGQLTEQGRGVPRDLAEARRLYQRASGLDEVGLPYVPVTAPAGSPGRESAPERGESDEARAEKTDRGQAGEAPETPPGPEVDFGSYHALVIGNDDYRSLPDLTTARRDADAVAEVLQRHYGFQITRLHDADRYQTLSALNQLRGRLTEQDNLLIYYAGHGELDRINMRGHWLPIDAERGSSANWISNVSITDLLNAMSARHVLVVADSCYSGALTRSALARGDLGASPAARLTWMRTMAGRRSRTALTSGGLTPVLDYGGGGHSLFARVLLEVLESNQGVMEGQKLFQEVTVRIGVATQRLQFEQVPEYAPLQYAGHEAGDFFFVPASL